MRGLRSTLVLLLVLVGIVAYIYFVESKREPASEETEKKERVFAVESAKIGGLTVRSSSGETTVLAKQGGRWTVTAPEAMGADETEVSGITSNLASLEVQRVVETDPKDLGTFGLATPRIEVAFTVEGDATTRHLFIGDKTATGGDLYARTGSAARVFLVPGWLESTFDRKTFDLRDKAVLKFERDKIDGLAVQSTGQTVRFAKVDNAWRMTEPMAVRADFGTVEGVIGRLTTGQMKSIAASGEVDLKTYGLDVPAHRVTLSAGSAQSSLLVGAKTPDGAYYARDASRPLVFIVDASLVDDLGKPAADYRLKDLFEFRSFSGDRFAVTRGDKTTVFEKQKGKEPDAAETWVQVQPAASVDESKILDLLSKASNLRAESFVDVLPAGAAEAAKIVARHGDSRKEETVVVYTAGADVLAVRPGEPGAARIAASEWNDALKLLDAVK